MDILKEKTIKNYTGWDIDCKYNSRNWNNRNKKLKTVFKKAAKRKLRNELRKELQNGI